MCMTDLEKIEDKYPQLKFWGIEVYDKHYHGHIEGTDVYINLLQPDIDWLKSALHETVHYDFDCEKDLSNNRNISVRRSEKWAVKESEREYEKMFGRKKKAE